MFAPRSARFGFEGFDKFLPEFTLKRIKHGKQICVLPEVHDLDLRVLIIFNQSIHQSELNMENEFVCSQKCTIWI